MTIFPIGTLPVCSPRLYGHMFQCMAIAIILFHVETSKVPDSFFEKRIDRWLKNYQLIFLEAHQKMPFFWNRTQQIFGYTERIIRKLLSAACWPI